MEVEDLPDCSRIFLPQTISSLGLTIINTLDIASGKQTKTVMLASSAELYASEESLYLTTTEHSFWGWLRPTVQKTQIHKFSTQILRRYEDTSSEKEFGYLEDGEFAIFFNIDK